MTEQNKNEVSDLEKKWMREFDNKFSSQWSSETDNCGEYISGSRAIAWQVYLSARKSAEVEIDELKSQSHILSSWEEMKVNLKSLEQENERLKKEVEDVKSKKMIEFMSGASEQLKEREEVIKEAIPWITDSVFPNYKNADQRIWGKETEEIKNWLEKANKITKGEG